jgi:MHS family proline/betaine transporter-like MFS transporter
MAPAIYVMIAAAISLTGTFYIRDARRTATSLRQGNMQ